MLLVVVLTAVQRILGMLITQFEIASFVCSSAYFNSAQSSLVTCNRPFGQRRDGTCPFLHRYPVAGVNERLKSRQNGPLRLASTILSPVQYFVIEAHVTLFLCSVWWMWSWRIRRQTARLLNLLSASGGVKVCRVWTFLTYKQIVISRFYSY